MAAPDVLEPRSRRALLGGMLGAVAATIASAIGRPLPVLAAGSDGSVLHVGDSYTDVQTGLYLSAAATDATVLSGVSSSAGGHGYGIGVAGVSGHGKGVEGASDDGWGVYGHSGVGTGVYATGGTGVYATGSLDYGVRGHSFATAGVYGSGGPVGVYGDGAIGVSGYSYGSTSAIAVKAESPEGRGVLALSATGTGMHGFAGAGTPPAAPTKTGVYGRSDIDSSARGVSGYSIGGAGIYGGTSTGKGVNATASGSGTAILASASRGTGYALRTSGRVSFAKVSGVATIAAGATAAPAISPGTDITTASYVLLTPQSDPGARRVWATLSATNNTVTIHTNATAATALKVAWLLVN